MSQTIGTPRPGTTEVDPVEFAARFVEQMTNKDLQFPSLYQCLLGADALPISGSLDHDYPPVYDRGLMPKDLFSTVHSAPIPAELQELLNQPDVGTCQMGLFPEMYRAWMTIDSDLYPWDFRDGSDLSFYDGLKEAIITMALVPVKPHVFRASIQYLLCVSTTSNIVILGFITASCNSAGTNPVMELVSQPIFTVSTEGVRFSVIVGSDKGRIILGATDGSVHEISYQSERGWISERCWKTNLTRSIFSSLLPKFFSSSTPDSVAQIVLDNLRHLMFTRSSEGAIAAYDLGHDGSSFRSLGCISFEAMITTVMKISKNSLEPNFIRKIISIGAIEFGEFNLVAVTDSGGRIYFSCYSPPQNGTRSNNIRPQCLQLVHVRMPPGHCPSRGARKPPIGQSAFLTQGIYAYLTRVNPEQDAVWLITPLMYPSQYFAEICSVHMLPGNALDIKAIPMQDKSFSGVAPLPDVITQHLPWSRQIVILTPNGTVVYRALKPYDLLRDLLMERKGPENLKGHFELCPNREQPLANVILLAAHPFNHLDQGIYDLATKAFFMYGSLIEPLQQQRQNITPHGNVSFTSPQTSGIYDTTLEFNPNLVSTPNRFTSFQQQDNFGTPQPQSPGSGNPYNPISGQHQFSTGIPTAGTPTHQQAFHQVPGGPHQQQQQMQSFQPDAISSPYTPRHDALYLVVARILLPFWHKSLVRVENIDGPNSPKIIVPNISGDEVSYAMTFLGSVLTFINNNPSLYISRVNVTPTSMATPDARRALSQEQEKNSIGALKYFISLTLEVLGMWKLLCEHQFHIVLHGVDDRLHNSTMKELVVNGYSTVAVIINALVSKYLGDNAAVDAISIRLREVCPTLFKNEDAIGSKVAEILAKVKVVSDPIDRDSMLQEALHLCEEICGHGRINVRSFCKQFADLGFPQGAVRLCLTSAHAADPNELSLSTLKGNNVSSDAAGLQAYQKRMEIYKIVFEILDTYVASSTSKQSPLINTVSIVQGDDTISREKAKEYADLMIRSILSSEDEPFHIALYN